MADVGAIGEALSALTSPVGLALDILIGPLAGLSDGLKEVVRSIEGFVGALSPGTLKVLEISMRDLYATIGVALLPIVQTLTEGFHQLAGILLPAMQALQPIFAQLANVMMALLVPAFTAISNVLVSLTPILDLFVDILRTAAEGLGVWWTVLSTLIQTIIGAFTGADDLKASKDLLEKFRAALYQVIGALLKVSVAIASLFGLEGFGKALAENLEKIANPPATGVGGAAQNIALKGFEQIQKDLALAAASAVAGGATPKEKGLLDYLPGLTTDLREIKDKDFSTVLIEAFSNEAFTNALTAAFKAALNIAPIQDEDENKRRLRENLGLQPPRREGGLRFGG